MATVKVTNTTLHFNEKAAIPEPVTAGTDGAKVSFENSEDAKILIILEATAETEATVLAGGGIQAVNDLVLSLHSGEKSALALESGMYMQTEGENKGAVVIKGANLKVSAIELP